MENGMDQMTQNMYIVEKRWKNPRITVEKEERTCYTFLNSTKESA